jgi:hypothetical protein
MARPMDSTLDSASKLRRRIACFAASIVAMAGLAAATSELHTSALEPAVAKVWACWEIGHPSNSGDIAIEAKDQKDSYGSCRKTGKWAAEHRYLLRELHYVRDLR